MNADQAARRAKRDAEWARRDAEAEQRARVAARIDDAAAAAPSVLPGEVGEALAAVLAAMKPFRAADGYLSFSAVGRSSDEVVALAEAILAVASDDQDYDDTYTPLSYCERRGDRCHTCSKATCTVVPWHGLDQPSSGGPA